MRLLGLRVFAKMKDKDYTEYVLLALLLENIKYKELSAQCVVLDNLTYL